MLSCGDSCASHLADGCIPTRSDESAGARSDESITEGILEPFGGFGEVFGRWRDGHGRNRAKSSWRYLHDSRAFFFAFVDPAKRENVGGGDMTISTKRALPHGGKFRTLGLVPSKACRDDVPRGQSGSNGRRLGFQTTRLRRCRASGVPTNNHWRSLALACVRLYLFGIDVDRCPLSQRTDDRHPKGAVVVSAFPKFPLGKNIGWMRGGVPFRPAQGEGACPITSAH
jgi:hypothetical protein